MVDTDGNRFYVTEGATIYIYSKKDLSLIKKFGRAGEGPQEFVVNQAIRMILRPNEMQVISEGKIQAQFLNLFPDDHPGQYTLSNH